MREGYRDLYASLVILQAFRQTPIFLLPAAHDTQASLHHPQPGFPGRHAQLQAARGDPDPEAGPGPAPLSPALLHPEAGETLRFQRSGARRGRAGAQGSAAEGVVGDQLLHTSEETCGEDSHQVGGVNGVAAVWIFIEG